MKHTPRELNYQWKLCDNNLYCVCINVIVMRDIHYDAINNRTRVSREEENKKT